MKRVITVAILLILTVSVAGCRGFRSFGSRGAPCQAAAPAPAVAPRGIPANTSYYIGTGCDSCNGGTVVAGTAAPGYSCCNGMPVDGQVIGTPIQGQVIGGQIITTPIEGTPLGSNTKMVPPESGFYSHVVSDRKIDVGDKLPSTTADDSLPSAKKATDVTNK